MKGCLKCFAVLLLPLLLLCSCSGNSDESVPEGVLRIFVDGSTTIAADGNDKVVFRIMYGSEDVSNSASMNLIRTYAGEDSRLEGGVNEFSTTTPGTYTFSARYYDSEAVFSDNSVVVTATPAGEEQTHEWVQKILGIQFTSSTCTGCPALSTVIRNLQSTYPGVLCPVAFHMDYIGADPMTIPASQTFANQLIGSSVALPAFFYNMHKPQGQSMTNIASVIEEEFRNEMDSYDPGCGISVKSGYDAVSGTVTVTAGVKSNLHQICRVLIFLVEDGIVSPQIDDKDYVHDNVVRTVMTSGTSGDYVNDRLPLYPGTEYTVVRTAEMSGDWNPDNMRVVACVMVQNESGSSYVCDNVNECALGGSAPYLTEE